MLPAILFGIVIWLSVRNSETKPVDITIVGNENDSVFTISINGINYESSLDMIRVPGGTFQMGATSEQGSDVRDDEKPVHQVQLSDFYIGETEVTQELWKAVMGNNPSECRVGDDYPVNMVSWEDIVNDFLPKLNQLTGKTFRLPTEAEWEYAARGGRSGGTKYSGSNNINDVAWSMYNSDSKMHTVKNKEPNTLGLYDMTGNVWEWCQDWYDSEFYKRCDIINPCCKEPIIVENDVLRPARVMRGGSWCQGTFSCRVSHRNCEAPDSCGNNLGFRLAFSAPKK